MARIGTAQALRQLIGSPNELVPHKIHAQLNARAIAFIARSPLLMLSTVDEQGQPSVSPKGDPPGFVQVVDNQTVLIPERKGNKLIFTLIKHVRSLGYFRIIFERIPRPTHSELENSSH